MKKLLLAISILAILSSCTPSPDPIDYGSDMCEYCKMMIVDHQHAAELVTVKGKVFKFDAIECMLHYTNENKATEFAFQLVNTFESPKELIAADSCRYLISKGLPSPMGAYLTAFKNKEVLTEIQEAKGGKIYDWLSLLQFFDENGLAGYSAN